MTLPDDDGEWGGRTVMVLLAVAGILVASWGATDWLYLVMTEAAAGCAALRVVLGGALLLAGALLARLIRSGRTAWLLGGLAVLVLLGGVVLYGSVAGG